MQRVPDRAGSRDGKAGPPNRRVTKNSAKVLLPRTPAIWGPATKRQFYAEPRSVIAAVTPASSRSESGRGNRENGFLAAAAGWRQDVDGKSMKEETDKQARVSEGGCRTGSGDDGSGHRSVSPAPTAWDPCSRTGSREPELSGGTRVADVAEVVAGRGWDGCLSEFWTDAWKKSAKTGSLQAFFHGGSG